MIVLDHVLADGLGGLLALADLVDSAPLVPAPTFPHRAPGAPALFADAFARRGLAIAKLAHRMVRQPGRKRPHDQGSLRTRPRPAARCCSRPVLGAPSRSSDVTSRRCTTRHMPRRNRRRRLPHRRDGASHELLCPRGELVTDIVAGVPISVRAKGIESGLRNRIVPVRVVLPGVGPTDQRLQRTSAVMRTRKAAVSAGSVPALVGWMLHAAGRVGLYAWFADRQRSIHTSISNVPGPAAPLRFAGLPIVDIVPLSVGGGGNVTLAFVMLAYRGTITTTIVADPDLAELAMLLRRELEAIVKLSAPWRPP